VTPAVKVPLANSENAVPPATVTPSTRRLTNDPASASTSKPSTDALVRLSVSEIPVSLDAIRSGADTVGGTVSPPDAVNSTPSAPDAVVNCRSPPPSTMMKVSSLPVPSLSMLRYRSVPEVNAVNDDTVLAPDRMIVSSPPAKSATTKDDENARVEPTGT